MKIKLFNCLLISAIIFTGQTECLIFDTLSSGISSGINAIKNTLGLGETKVEQPITADDLVIAGQPEVHSEQPPSEHAHSPKHGHHKHHKHGHHHNAPELPVVPVVESDAWTAPHVHHSQQNYEPSPGYGGGGVGITEPGYGGGIGIGIPEPAQTVNDIAWSSPHRHQPVEPAPIDDNSWNRPNHQTQYEKYPNSGQQNYWHYEPYGGGGVY